MAAHGFKMMKLQMTALVSGIKLMLAKGKQVLLPAAAAVADLCSRLGLIDQQREKTTENGIRELELVAVVSLPKKGLKSPEKLVVSGPLKNSMYALDTTVATQSVG